MSPLQSSVRTLLCLLALLSFFSGGEVRAQEEAALPGSRVRVWTGLNERGNPTGPRRTGQITAWTADSVVLDAPGARGALAVPITSVSRMDVSRPRTVLEGAGRIGAVGVVIGGVTGAVLGIREGDDWFFSAKAKAVGYGIILGGAGGLAGMLVGALAPGERWQRVPLPGQVSVSPGGRDGVAVSTAFRF
jgi:hypothetical protein